MCLVHCNTQWTRVVRDVSLEFYCCLPKILFPTDLPGIFWSLTQPNGCRFLAAKAVLSGVECGSELYCFLSQGPPLSLCITPTPHAMSGARPTLVVGSGFFIFRHAVTSRLKKGNKQRKYMYESVCEISVHNVPDTLMPTCRSVQVNVNTRTLAIVREKKREHVS